ncbi:MAG: winged helix-turn-helix domain-containing protein [Holosporaceae bacterium]|nr:MAG: winged helix-turn-helix domain-containing protein [Holosporaceae bacterium]
MTEKEVSLLVFLDKEKGAPISRDDLLKKVWGYGKASQRTPLKHIFISSNKN